MPEGDTIVLLKGMMEKFQRETPPTAEYYQKEKEWPSSICLWYKIHTNFVARELI